MGRHKSSKAANLRDLEIMKSQEVDHDTWEETAEKVGVSLMTITRTKRKQSYRDIVIAALENEEETPETFAKSLKGLMHAKKSINTKEDGVVEVEDNVIQFNAVKKFGDILGVDAPKEFDLKHSMASMSDNELQEAVDNSVKEIDGRIQHRVTGTSDAATVVTNTVVAKEPAMARGAGKQTVCPTGA